MIGLIIFSAILQVALVAMESARLTLEGVL